MDELEKANQLGVPVWLIAILASMMLIAVAAPKIIKPISESLSAWGEGRRAREVARDDAQISERDATITYTRAELATVRGELEVRDRMAFDHRIWDAKAIGCLTPEEAEALGPPPPIQPVCPLAATRAQAQQPPSPGA